MRKGARAATGESESGTSDGRSEERQAGEETGRLKQARKESKEGKELKEQRKVNDQGGEGLRNEN